MRYQVEMEPFFNMLAYIEYILGFVICKPRYHTRDVILDCNVKDVWANAWTKLILIQLSSNVLFNKKNLELLIDH